MTEKHKRYYDYLQSIYEDWFKHHVVKNIKTYAEVAGVNVSTSTILVKLGIIEHQNPASIKSGKYIWKLRKPDETMVLEVKDALLAYYKPSQSKSINKKLSVSEHAVTINFDQFIEIFDKLPKDKLNLLERKKITKEIMSVKK